MSGHLGRVCVWGVVVSGGVVFGVGGRVKWVGWPWGGSAGVLVAPVCNTENNRRPPGTPATSRIEIGPVPVRDRSGSAWPARRRGTHDELEGESRMPHLGTINTQQTCGTGPISARVTTDFGGEVDRSRREFRPISGRVTTDLEPECDRSRRRGRLGGPKKSREATGVHRSVDTAVARPVVAGIVPRS